MVSLKGRRHCSIISCRKRTLATVVIYMHTAGHFVPPVVYPWVKMEAELLISWNSSWHSCSMPHKSGVIETEIFTQWFQQFFNHVKPKVENLAFLMLNVHFSHTRNIQLLDLAWENCVHIVCFPLLRTHKLKPLVLFMLTLNTYYVQETESWLRMNPTWVVSISFLAYMAKLTLRLQL